MSYVYKYPRPMVTVDGVVFGLDREVLQVLLIKRLHSPYKGMWALPGGFITNDETLEEAVEREVEEETGLDCITFYPLKAYSDPDRDPRGRNISFAYLGLFFRLNGDVRAGDDAAEAQWFSFDELPRIAFDHEHIISDGISKLRELTLTSNILIDLLPKPFPFSMLKRAIEIILEGPINEKKVLEHFCSMGSIIEAGIVKNNGENITLYRVPK